MGAWEGRWEEFKGLCEITDLQDNHIKLQRDGLKKQRKKNNSPRTMNSLKGDEGKIEFKSEQGNVWHLRQESQSWCEREVCVRLSVAAHASTPKQAKLQGQ